MKLYQQSFLSNHFRKTVQELWTDFTTALYKLSQECIPSKIIHGKSSLPWITHDIKRLIRKRDSLYTKLKKNLATQTLRPNFSSYGSKFKRKLKTRTWALRLNDSENTCDNKKSFSFLKNSCRDQQGTPPLKQNNILRSDTNSKANIFNQQFYA